MVHQVLLRDHQDGSHGITIPKDILEYASLLDPDGDLRFAEDATPTLFLTYDPDTREVAFQLPSKREPPGRTPTPRSRSKAAGSRRSRWRRTRRRSSS